MCCSKRHHFELSEDGIFYYASVCALLLFSSLFPYFPFPLFSHSAATTLPFIFPKTECVNQHRTYSDAAGRKLKTFETFSQGQWEKTKRGQQQTHDLQRHSQTQHKPASSHRPKGINSFRSVWRQSQQGSSLWNSHSGALQLNMSDTG